MRTTIRFTRIALAVGLATLAPFALGQKMYKCSDGKGGTTFQQSPCPETAQEADARAKEKERLEAEAARKKEEEARRKAEAVQKARERDKAFEEKAAERARIEGAERKAMGGAPKRQAAYDGSLPSEIERLYPAPWRENVNPGVTAAFQKNNTPGCAHYRYRGRGTGLSGEFLVQCKAGESWTSYFVWSATGAVKGPVKL